MRVILFNFYPYRERRQSAALKRYFMALVAAATVAGALAVVVSQEFQARVDAKLSYLDRLDTFKVQVAEQVQQTKDIQARVEALNRQVQALKSVERDSMQVSHWLSFFEQTKPEAVTLKRVFTQDGALELQGATTTVNVLAGWVEKMELGNALFDSVGLVHVLEQESPREDGVDDLPLLHDFRLVASPRKEGV